MPALRQVAPIIFKALLEAAEWSVYSEDKWNWSMVDAGGTLSVELPKKGRFVSFQVMEHVLAHAEILPGDYFPRRQRGGSEDGFEDQPRIQ